jgi:hypothetical protein
MSTTQIDGPSGVTEWTRPPGKCRAYLLESPTGVPRPYENAHPPGNPLGPKAQTYGRVLGGLFSHERGTPVEPPSYIWGFETYTSHVRHHAEILRTPLLAFENISLGQVICSDEKTRQHLASLILTTQSFSKRPRRPHCVVKRSISLIYRRHLSDVERPISHTDREREREREKERERKRERERERESQRRPPTTHRKTTPLLQP